LSTVIISRVVEAVQLLDRRSFVLSGNLRHSSDFLERESLPVILVCYNYAGYASRYAGVRAAQARFAATSAVTVYTVELAYGDAPFRVTSGADPRHWQVRLRGTDDEPPLWHKLNLVNVAVARLLPRNWRAFCFVDSEVVFANATWAQDTLRAFMSGSFDVLQPFSHVSAYGSNYVSVAAREVGLEGSNATHAGYAWAVTRGAFDAMGGLYDRTVTGGDDSVTALAFAGEAGKVYYEATWGRLGTTAMTHDWYADIAALRSRTRGFRVGAVPGTISHIEHGRLDDKGYVLMMKLGRLLEPRRHLQYNSDGLLVPTRDMPSVIVRGVRDVFVKRREDAPAETSEAELVASRSRMVDDYITVLRNESLLPLWPEIGDAPVEATTASGSKRL
jgi:hypothetical protein